MKIDEIKKIIKMLENSDVKEMEFEENGAKIKIVRDVVSKNSVTTVIENSSVNKTTEPETKKNDSVFIKSNMPGTFYRKPSPDSPAYVKEGDVINEDTVVCIIEAMKIFNEIKAGISGKIIKILAKDGEGVEFGQPLFEMEKV